MKKIILALSLFIMLPILSGCTKDSQIIQLEKENQELRSKLQVEDDKNVETQVLVKSSEPVQKNPSQISKPVSSLPDLDVQLKCSDASEKFFKANYISNDLTYFTNHWNNDLKKCFILVNYTEYKYNNSVVYKGRELYDVYEHNKYATISFGDDVTLCYLYTSGNANEAKECNSGSFDVFVSQYMNN